MDDHGCKTGGILSNTTEYMYTYLILNLVVTDLIEEANTIQKR
jgi:hypothetical protein